MSNGTQELYKNMAHNSPNPNPRTYLVAEEWREYEKTMVMLESQMREEGIDV